MFRILLSALGLSPPLILAALGAARALEPPAPFPIEPPGARFVACDNGIRCVMAPCPSRSAANLDAGEVTRGVGFDLSPLTDEDKAQLRVPGALYDATTVVVGHIEERESPVMGPKIDSGTPPRSFKTPVLVVSAVLGPSSAAEAAQCRAAPGPNRLAPAPPRQ